MTHKKRFKPHVTVAWVVQAKGQFLLVDEWINGQLLLNQPAGHLEMNETIIHAAQRELLEETGLRATPDALLTILQWTAADNTPFIRFTFVLDLPEVILCTPQDPAIQCCLWLPLEQIIQATNLRSPLVKESLRYYCSNQRYPLAILSSFSL